MFQPTHCPRKKEKNYYATLWELSSLQLFLLQINTRKNNWQLILKPRLFVCMHFFLQTYKRNLNSTECVTLFCRQSKQTYALKVINKEKCRGKEHMIENEVNILRRIKHENIIQLIEDFDVDSEFYLVMELVQVRFRVSGMWRAREGSEPVGCAEPVWCS